MANVFNSVKGLHPRRNSFSAHTYRNDFTAQLGLNVPCYIQDLVPGSRIKVDTYALARLQALLSPIMDNIDFYVHFWVISNRLLEDDRFTAFISGEIDAEEYDALFLDPHDFAHSLAIACQGAGSEQGLSDDEIYTAIVGDGSIFDFCGYDKSMFPENLDDAYNSGEVIPRLGYKINFRPIIGYYMLHLNWYMNENVPYFEDFKELVDTLIKDQDLDSLIGLLVRSCQTFGYSLLPHGWEKDYFTSALPNVQFGDPVTLPIVGTAPVTVTEFGSGTMNLAQLMPPQNENYAWLADQSSAYLIGQEGTRTAYLGSSAIDQNFDPVEAYIPGFYFAGGTFDGSGATGTADLSEASAISINELRFANALQVFKEREQRFGRRRQEYYKGFFDVTPEDLRLQLPKYLGGGRIPINIADVEQTSATSGSQALAHLAGKGTAVAGGFAGFNTFVSEESIIIGICFAMPHITYANSLSRHRLKTNDKFDYFNPSFEHLGEQAINKCEIFAGSTDPLGEFGYTPRFNEYRFHSNEMHGQFKSSLAFWTLGRIFDSTPALNADFIYMQPSNFDRIFAVSGQPNLLASMLFRTRVIQPVSKYGTPMLLA